MTALLNTCIMPLDGTYARRTITRAQALTLIEGQETVSYVGHAAACDAMSLLLEVPVAQSRERWLPTVGDIAISLQMRGRIPEGTILDTSQMDAIGYDLVEVVRLA